MRRLAHTLVLTIVLSLAPVVAFGEPSEDLAFIQMMPIIFEGRCIGGEVKGSAQYLPCEVRAQREGRLWPQELYYLIVFTAAGREVLAISTFSVEGERVLYSYEQK